MTEAPPQPLGPTSYALLLPPGWHRLPVGRDGEEALDRLLDRVFADAPKERTVALKWQMREALLGQMKAAAEQGGLDLYVPIDTTYDRPVAASFVVAQGPDVRELRPDADPEQVAAMLVAEIVGEDAANTPVAVGGTTGVRTDRVLAADPAQTWTPGGDPADRATRRVDYLLQVPDTGGWLVVSFSTAVLTAEDDPEPPGGGVRFDELLVQLFDAIMTTIRWRYDR